MQSTQILNPTAAALKIQALYRGHAVRKALDQPILATPNLRRLIQPKNTTPTRLLRYLETPEIQKTLNPLGRTPRVLIVGDADLSFSRALNQKYKDLTIWATTYESEARLQGLYPQKFAQTKAALDLSPKVKVLHEVDATQLKSHPLIGKHQFDLIIFNFPHTGTRDSGTSDLVSGFLKSARDVQKDNALLLMSLVDTPYYDGRYLAVPASRKNRYQLSSRPLFDPNRAYTELGYCHRETKENRSAPSIAEYSSLGWGFKKIASEDPTFDSSDDSAHSSGISDDEGRFDRAKKIEERRKNLIKKHLQVASLTAAPRRQYLKEAQDLSTTNPREAERHFKILGEASPDVKHWQVHSARAANLAALGRARRSHQLRDYVWDLHLFSSERENPLFHGSAKTQLRLKRELIAELEAVIPPTVLTTWRTKNNFTSREDMLANLSKLDKEAFNELLTLAKDADAPGWRTKKRYATYTE